jgi:hypothetical protein
MVQQLQTWHRSLGGIDCETCGFSFDEVEITRTAGEELFDVQVRLGCTGGAFAEGLTLDGLKAWLDSELGHIDEFRHVRKALRKELTENRPTIVEDIPDYEAEDDQDDTVDPVLEAKWDAEVKLLMGEGMSFGSALAALGRKQQSESAQADFVDFDKLP